MCSSPTPLHEFDPESSGSTTGAGRSVDAGRGRVFPCGQCGADLVFSIGQQSLKCPYCGHVETIQLPADQKIEEQDLEGMLARIQERHDLDAEDTAVLGEHEVRCDGCGANVVFSGPLTSRFCPYCGAPIQRDKVHDAPQRIKVDAVLPFLVERTVAASNLRSWVSSLWFAPNDFKKHGAHGDFQGVYLPYFTFDAMTYTRWSGQRGDHYYVEVGTGKEKRRERRTRWSWQSGDFQEFFDDVLVLAAQGMNHGLVLGLEPWPLGQCIVYTPDVMAGLFARTYDIDLPECFRRGKERIDGAIASRVRREIGGDEQRVDSIDTHYSALTFKHVLLPVWLLAYQYQNKTYQVMINAATGEVQGERPYSWIKITLAVLAAMIVVGTVVALTQR